MSFTETKTAQAAVIFCDPDREKVEALTTLLSAQLAPYAATILSTGRSLVRHEGFVVVEVVPGLPGLLLHWLKSHPEVRDYMIYDVPSQEIEYEAHIDAAVEEVKTSMPPGVRRVIAQLGEWLSTHHYQLTRNAATSRLELVPQMQNEGRAYETATPKRPQHSEVKTSMPPDHRVAPEEHMVLITYRPSARGCGAVFTHIEATEGLVASLRSAHDPILVALPLSLVGSVSHTFADIWQDDEVELRTASLKMVIACMSQGELP